MPLPSSEQRTIQQGRDACNRKQDRERQYNSDHGIESEGRYGTVRLKNVDSPFPHCERGTLVPKNNK